MSASDYTNLRRIRHVYHPTMNNCNTNVQPQVVYTTPSQGNCFVGTYPSYPHHSHVPSYPQVHHPHSHYVPAYHPHNHCATAHHPRVHYPYSYQGHGHGHFGCHPEEHVHEDHDEDHADDHHHHEPCNCNNHPHHSPHHVHHTHETVVVHKNHHGDCYNNHHPVHAHSHVHTPNHSHSNVVSHNHCQNTLGSLVTRYQYLITPSINGSVTFSVQPNLHFTKDMRVTVTSDASNNNYIEGSVYYYNPCNGEITIYKITTVNGTFTNPSKYVISFGTPFQEIDKLKLRTAELYEKVFGTPSTTTPLTAEQIQAADVQTKAVFNYFFSENIENDGTYALTEEYLTTKVNTVYTYFFDVTLSTNPSFNPNNNGVVIDTLPKKIEQLNLYFFGTTTPSL